MMKFLKYPLGALFVVFLILNTITGAAASLDENWAKATHFLLLSLGNLGILVLLFDAE